MVTGPACLLAVHPHPDDESISMGGTLLHYGSRGVETHVVTCTGGEAGDNLAGIDLGGRDLADVRREEMADAAAVLGLTSHAWLGYRDSGMVGTTANADPRAFTNADLDTAALRLAGHVRRRRPDVVASDGPDGTYGHPDHVMAHRVTARAVDLAADPGVDLDGPPHRVDLHACHAIPRREVRRLHRELRARDLTSPFDDATIEAHGVREDELVTVLDVADHLPGKLQAMLAHRSQIARESAFLNLPPDLAPDLFGRECYAAAPGFGPVDDDARERRRHDLLAGSHR